MAIKLLSNNSSAESTKTAEEDNSPIQSSSKYFDNQTDDYWAKQKNTYENIKGSTGHRASKNDIPTNSIDQQPSRTFNSTTQIPYGSMKEINNTLKAVVKETTQSKQSKKRKSKKIAGTADTIEKNTVRDASVLITSENRLVVRQIGARIVGFMVKAPNLAQR